MAKNDVDKLHEQKAERGREEGWEGRGERKKGRKKQTRRLAPKPRGMYTAVQNRGGKDGRDGGGRGRNNEGVILEN